MLRSHPFYLKQSMYHTVLELRNLEVKNSKSGLSCPEHCIQPTKSDANQILLKLAGMSMGCSYHIQQQKLFELGLKQAFL